MVDAGKNLCSIGGRKHVIERMYGAAACGGCASCTLLLPGYSGTPNFKHTMVVACKMQLPPSVGEYMGICIDGGYRVKGVGLLRHYSTELIGRGDVVEERLDFFNFFHTSSDSRFSHDSVMIQKKKPTEPKSRLQYRRWSCVTHLRPYLHSPLLALSTTITYFKSEAIFLLVLISHPVFCRVWCE